MSFIFKSNISESSKVNIIPEHIYVKSGEKVNYARIQTHNVIGNKNYYISVNDVNISVVRGLVLYGLQPGETFMSAWPRGKDREYHSVKIPITVTE